MSQYGLTEGQCNQQVSEAHLEELSRSGCKQWKSLPPYLKLETIVAEDIDKSQKEERDKRYDFLLTWKDIEGSNATYRQLITALLKIKCRQDAEKLCEMLKKSIATASTSSRCAGKHCMSVTHQGKKACRQISAVFEQPSAVVLTYSICLKAL